MILLRHKITLKTIPISNEFWQKIKNCRLRYKLSTGYIFHNDGFWSEDTIVDISTSCLPNFDPSGVNENITFHKVFTDTSSDIYIPEQYIAHKDIATSGILPILPISSTQHYTSSPSPFTTWNKKDGRASGASGKAKFNIYSISPQSSGRGQEAPYFQKPLESNTLYIMYLGSKVATSGEIMDNMSNVYDVSWANTGPLTTFEKADFFPNTSRKYYSVLSNLNSKTNGAHISFNIIIPQGLTLYFPLGFDSYDYIRTDPSNIIDITIKGGGIINGNLLPYLKYTNKSWYDHYTNSGLLQLAATGHINLENISVVNGFAGRGKSATQLNAYNVDGSGEYYGNGSVDISNCEFVLNPQTCDGLDSLAKHTQINNTYIQSHDDNLKLSSNTVGSNITIFGGSPSGGAGGCINIGSYGYNPSADIIMVDTVYLHALPSAKPGDTCAALNWTGVGVIYAPYLLQVDNALISVKITKIHNTLDPFWASFKTLQPPSLFVGGNINDPCFGILSCSAEHNCATRACISSSYNPQEQYFNNLSKLINQYTTTPLQWTFGFENLVMQDIYDMVSIFSNIAQYYLYWNNIGITLQEIHKFETTAIQFNFITTDSPSVVPWPTPDHNYTNMECPIASPDKNSTICYCPAHRRTTVINQEWLGPTNDSTIRFNNALPVLKCIDLSGGYVANGNSVNIWDCSISDTGIIEHQQWLGPDSGTKGAILFRQSCSKEDCSKCLDLSGGDDSNGTSVNIWDCNDGQHQQWQYDTGSSRIQYSANPKKCLDIPGGDMKNGNKLQIWDCNTLPHQQWIGGGEYQYQSKKDKKDNTMCIDLSGGNISNGTPITIWDCAGSRNRNPNQRWLFEPSGTTGKGQIKSRINLSNCIDVHGGNFENGNPLQIWECNESGNQNFKLSIVNKTEGSFQFESLTQFGKCIDLSGGIATNGNQLQIWDCQ